MHELCGLNKGQSDKTYLCLNIDESPNIDAFIRSAQYQTVEMFDLEQD